MEKVRKLLKMIAVAGALAIAFVNSQSTLDLVAGDSTLKNLNALQASAGELWCDTSNQLSCTFRVGDLVGHSTGDMHMYP